MGAPPCRVCESCGSTLGYGPGSHVEPIPHEVYAEIQRGQIIARCHRCHEVRPVEEAVNLEDVRGQIKSLVSALP